MSQMSAIYFGYNAYDTIMMGRYSFTKINYYQCQVKKIKNFVMYYMEKLRISAFER